jgi:hypothetical protein
MSVKVATLSAEITANTSQFQASLKESKAAMNAAALGLGDLRGKMVQLGQDAAKLAAEEKALTTAQKDVTVSAGDVGKAILGQVANYLTLGGAIAGIIELEKASINAAAENETAMVRLEGTFKSMGRAGAEAMEASASTLMKLSAFDDENIMAAYTAIAKFENIDTGDMERLVKTAMDVTAVMGGDLASNAENIGRILETGLVPRTWAFDAALKEQVKQQVEAGDTGAALNTVLVELNKRYGGQAAAEMDTYAGKIKILKNNWGEFLETVGSKQLVGGKSIVDLGITWVEAMTATANKGWDAFTLITQFRYRQAAAMAADALREAGAVADDTSKSVVTLDKGERDVIGTTKKLNDVILVTANILKGNAFARYTSEWLSGQQEIIDKNKELADKQAKDFEKLMKGYDDLIKKQNEEANAIIKSKTSWEQAYTAEKDAAGRTQADLDLLQSGLEGLGQAGSLVWEGFLLATGKISPAAMEQFIRVQAAVAEVQKGIASGFLDINKPDFEANLKSTVDWLTSRFKGITTEAPINIKWKLLGMDQKGFGKGATWWAIDPDTGKFIYTGTASQEVAPMNITQPVDIKMKPLTAGIFNQQGLPLDIQNFINTEMMGGMAQTQQDGLKMMIDTTASVHYEYDDNLKLDDYGELLDEIRTQDPIHNYVYTHYIDTHSGDGGGDGDGKTWHPAQTVPGSPPLFIPITIPGYWAQHGADMWVDKPTMFMVGEVGREHVTVTPAGKTASGTGTTINIYGFTGDLTQLAREVERRQTIQRLMQ